MKFSISVGKFKFKYFLTKILIKTGQLLKLIACRFASSKWQEGKVKERSGKYDFRC
jgi:hypothetical protein